jgi:hypothetical protein
MNAPLAAIRELTPGLSEGADREHAVEALSFQVEAGNPYTKALLAAVSGRARS